MNGWRYFRLCALAFRCESNGLIQAEFEDRFRGNDHLLALGEHLGSRTAGGPDSCAFSVSNDRTNDCSDYGSSSDHFSRARVRPKSTSTFFLQVRGGDVISPPVDGYGLNVERNLGGTRNTARRHGSNNE